MLNAKDSKKTKYSQKKKHTFCRKIVFHCNLYKNLIVYVVSELQNTIYQMRQLKITKQVTNRETASLDKYLQEIGKVELITADEEVILAQKIRSGDKVALEKLIKANLRFVVSVSKQYQNQGLSLPDLINEGNLGLMKAAKRYDETRGFKFISYAVWWIRQSILQRVAEQPLFLLLVEPQL